MTEFSANLEAALRSGALPNLDAVAQVRQSETSHGRAVDIRVMDGIDIRLLPDRGLDIGAAWFAGQPLAWVSQVGETGPLPALDDMAWSGAFGGGLLTTCGLRNVGMPSEGHGLHGTYSHLPATDVAVVTDQNGKVTVTATVLDEAAPSSLLVARTITTTAGHRRLEVTDLTTNIGEEPADAPLLYHLNFGYPLWHGAAVLEIAAIDTIARDRDSERSRQTWHRPPPIQVGPERVLEHIITPEDGWGRARLHNADLGLALTAQWRIAELPRLHQWLDPNPGMAVLGIEPANCSTSGRAHDRAEGRLPSLDPGEVRSTALTIEVEPMWT